MNILIAGIPEQTTNYVAALEHAGACVRTGFHTEDISGCDALVLPGGTDIDPAFYHQPIHGARKINRALDQQQFDALDQFIQTKRPVLGICKGMQLINVYLGGTLIQHIETASLHQAEGKDLAHRTWTSNDSFLSHLYGTCFSTNSSHHQALGRLGTGLRVVQETADYIPEAIVHETLPVMGVQWHPERMCLTYRREDTVDGMELFHYFINQFLQPSHAHCFTHHPG